MSGCSLLEKKKDEGASADDSAIVSGETPAKGGEGKTDKTDKHDVFSLTVVSDDKVIRDYLTNNLELQRYRHLDDLDEAELSRLMAAAEPNARNLLATLGYFTPTLTLVRSETPDSPKAPRELVITIDPGPKTLVSNVDVQFAGAIANSDVAADQRRGIVSGWSLPPGQPFSQPKWDGAKNGGLRALVAKRYPTGNIKTSRAEIDADDHHAKLSVIYDSGPGYRFGPLQVRGASRYDPDAARRIARVPVGTEYDQQKLLDAQQRLASSGYYDSVFLTLNTDGTDAQAVPVIAQVTEAQLQKLVLGFGFTTDKGPRISVDHTHNKLPLLGWRAVTKVSIDKKDKTLSSEITGLPDENYWRYFGSALIKREQLGVYDTDSSRLRYGRNKTDGHIDRSYFLQYDYAVNRVRARDKDNEDRIDALPKPASTISANWGWTGRYFDRLTAPQSGYGLGIELGAGYTLLGERSPYLRTQLRGLGLVPLFQVKGDNDVRTRSSRLQLRAEFGAVVAKDSARIPATQLFLTGGDTTVRGYNFREIGAVNVNGDTVPGRYLASGGLEWQHPIVYNGKLTDFESVVFVDAGAVADKPSQFKLKIGTGAGVRWDSPVGLVQADLGYGLATRKLRLHLRLGFSF
ncbi:MAG: BamA/TamA family outer membrane protein [Variovorax sp.]